MLLIGGGPAVGYGVLSHDLALPGNIARLLSTATGRGVDVDVIAHSDTVVAHLPRAIRSVQLARYDAIVLMIGVNDALRISPLGDFGRDMSSVLAHLQHTGHEALCTVVVAVPVISKLKIVSGPAAWFADRHAIRLNEELRRACAGANSSNTVITSLQAPIADHERHRGPETFRRWSTRLVEPIAALLSSPGVSAARRTEQRQDEHERQQSLERLGILNTAPEERFDRIAAIAQQLFGTAGAALTFVDGDRQWFKARRGFDIDETARGIAFCDHTIERSEAFIVPDAASDPRFEANPLVTGEHHLRFYAGYPIESPDGHRIGAFCVIDTEPRSFSESDTVLLRNLALMMQDEIWDSRDNGEGVQRASRRVPAQVKR